MHTPAPLRAQAKHHTFSHQINWLQRGAAGTHTCKPGSPSTDLQLLAKRSYFRLQRLLQQRQGIQCGCGAGAAGLTKGRASGLSDFGDEGVGQTALMLQALLALLQLGLKSLLFCSSAPHRVPCLFFDLPCESMLCMEGASSIHADSA